METDGQFWLGLAFAIPLSIAANLFTPKIQDWLSKRSIAAASERQKIRLREQARIEELAIDTSKLHTFLLTTVVIATMLTAGIGVFASLLYMLSAVTESSLGTVAAQAVSVFGGLVVTKICLDGANMAIRVKEHKANTPKATQISPAD